MHAASGSKENWLQVPQIIADETKRKGYAYDARNHGDSEHTEEYSFEMNVDDLFHFMDTIKAPKAILIGGSMGGITAIKAALKKPERVEMIFIEDMFVKKCPQELLDAVGGAIQLWLSIVAEIPKELDTTEAIKYCVDTMFTKIPPELQLLTDKEKLYKAGFVFNRSPGGEYSVKYNEKALLKAIANFKETVADPVGQYDGPAYFIYGTFSPFAVGKEEEHIKKHFPKAELIPIEGVGHDVHLGNLEKFLEIVLQRLKR